MMQFSYLQSEGVNRDVHCLRGRLVHVSLEEHLAWLQHCCHIVFPLLSQEGTSHHLKFNTAHLERPPPLPK